MLQLCRTQEYIGDNAGGDFQNGELIATNDYYIQHMENGVDELHFTLKPSDQSYAKIAEERRILETTTQQVFIIKTIDAGQKTAEIGCQLDLDDWRADCLLGYNSGNKTAAVILQEVCPAGWTIRGDLSDTKKREITMDGPTPLEVAMNVQERFGLAITFYNNSKIATVSYPDKVELSNAFVVDSVNLNKNEHKGKSTDLYTRLYPIGKDGLRIGSVNNGVDYVESRSYGPAHIICKVWVDERYTDAQSLKEDAQAKVDAAAKPARSWELDVADLNRINAEIWPHLRMNMFDVILLVDRYKQQRYQVQIRQQRLYPYYPEKNKIYVSTVAASVQRSLRQMSLEISNPNSALWQRLNAR